MYYNHTMRKGCSLFLIFILIASLSTSSFVEIAFAERNSVFNKIADSIKYPFHSAAKAVGWDGTPSKFSGQTEPSAPLPSFITMWMCKILVGDAQKVYGNPPVGTPTICDAAYYKQFFQ